MDYISREDAIKMLFNNCKRFCPEEAMDWSIRDLGSMPAADVVERKKGKWLAKDFHTCVCSECRFDFDIMKCDFLESMNFCPNCGADMREGKQW